MKIYQITDTHLADIANESDDNLIRLLDVVNQDKEDNVLLLTGDLANAAVPAAYLRIRSYLEDRDNITHCYALAGNHDDLDCMRASFNGSKIQIAQSATVQDIPFHFLDTSHKPLGNSLELGAGRVSNKSISALQKAIRKSPRLIISHHPIINVSDRWFRKIGIENQAKVVRCFTNKCNIISGHAHHYFDIEEGNIRQLVGIASSYGFEHQSDMPQRTNSIGMTVYHAGWLNGDINVRLLEKHFLIGR